MNDIAKDGIYLYSIGSDLGYRLQLELQLLRGSAATSVNAKFNPLHRTSVVFVSVSVSTQVYEKVEEIAILIVSNSAYINKALQF
jgi:hypothetical protein